MSKKMGYIGPNTTLDLEKMKSGKAASAFSSSQNTIKYLPQDKIICHSCYDMKNTAIISPVLELKDVCF